jgi:hypothetical protein
MKSKILMLSFAVLSISEIGAAQEGNKGDVIVQHSPQSLHKSYDTPNETARNGSKVMTNTNPNELARKSDDYFEKGQFRECAEAFLYSAIFGNNESREAIEEIDPNSIVYLGSRTPQSAAALLYYKGDLIPKLTKYFEDQFALLKAHADKPVTVFGK